MGEVYRARDPRLARDFAIKVLPAVWVSDAERRERFEREARAAARSITPMSCRSTMSAPMPAFSSSRSISV